MKNTKLIAFYLPQFHTIPENNEWWGMGFTEWTNVTKAKSLFDGHYQPHLPTDMGFYDLRVRETRREQSVLAQKYGIDGFCYHYYWFSGKRLLHEPLDDNLIDKENKMPFCLCWANENWTRRWDASEHLTLIEQKYLPDDDINFIKSIIKFITDSRYIKVNNAPLIIIYRPQKLPNPNKTIRVWKEYCRSIGIGEIHVCAALTHGNEDYHTYGFDSGVEFPPHNLNIKNINSKINTNTPFSGNIYNYSEVAKYYLEKKYAHERVFKTVFPSWDNTARTNNRALVVINGTPKNYESWLSSTIDLKNQAEHEKIVFINAWNEWAEGCHLEPDRRHGRLFLEATLNAKIGRRRFKTNEYPDENILLQEEAFFSLFLLDFRNLLFKHSHRLLNPIKNKIKANMLLYSIAAPMLNIFRTLYFKSKK